MKIRYPSTLRDLQSSRPSFAGENKPNRNIVSAKEQLLLSAFPCRLRRPGWRFAIDIGKTLWQIHQDTFSRDIDVDKVLLCERDQRLSRFEIHGQERCSLGQTPPSIRRRHMLDIAYRADRNLAVVHCAPNQPVDVHAPIRKRMPLSLRHNHIEADKPLSFFDGVNVAELKYHAALILPLWQPVGSHHNRSFPHKGTLEARSSKVHLLPLLKLFREISEQFGKQLSLPTLRPDQVC